MTENMVWTASVHFPLPPLEVQADLVEQRGADTLLFCPDPWALRHIFINQQTGEMIRARCNRWDCLFCGPRKVDQWRQLVKAAEPTLFITLSKAGKTVEEASRALITFLQYVRRGSKGRGPNRIGAREAYLIEYFGVLERHSDFEENGFHWHLLVKGVDFVPHEVLKEGWRSARHNEAYIVYVQAIRKPHVIGYVTKYLTKSLSWGEKGCATRNGKDGVASRRQWAYRLVAGFCVFGRWLMARVKKVSTIQPLLLSVADVAVRLGVCRQTVYTFIYREGLPSILVGRIRRVHPDSLEGWLRERECRIV